MNGRIRSKKKYKKYFWISWLKREKNYIPDGTVGPQRTTANRTQPCFIKDFFSIESEVKR